MPSAVGCVSLLLALAVMLPHHALAQDADLFPFEMNALAAPETPIDLSFLSPGPAGAEGFVRVREGHFVDGAGQRLRLLGTNFTFAGAFPEQANAEAIAARLRQFGVNVVRFHHMDNREAPAGIWNKEKTAFDPAQADRLDTIIYQLKQHGIYANINLHVSRNYPGLPKDRTYRYGKVLDNFYPPYIEMQKQYARDLLTHVNPYTKAAYAKEPCICAVELNNENTLLGAGLNTLRNLPEPFLGELTRQWRAWLRAKYGTTAALREAWKVGSEPLGKELLTDGDFTRAAERWTFEQSNTAKLEHNVVEGPEAGQRALHVTTLNQGQEPWNLQVHQVGLSLEDGQVYTFSFQAKSDAPRSISVGCRLDQAPWRFLGLQTSVALTTEWRTFRLGFVAQDPLPEHARVSFDLNNQLGQFWFASVSLRPGGVFGLPEAQSLEADNIPLPPPDATPAALTDFTAFKMGAERAYVAEMVRYLKEELGVEAPIVDTQASYGGLGGVYREGTLSDYVDIHSYWQHPRFPHRPWDSRDWRIANTPMTRDANGGTLARLAAHRVAGKPFTVSEYDHPAPSEYSAEMFPMVAAFAALQDWDGIYQFNYEASDEARLRGYFNMAAHPAKMCFLPVASVMFRMGAVSSAEETLTLRVPEGAVLPHLVKSGPATEAWSKAGVPPTASLLHGLQIEMAPGEGEITASRTLDVPEDARRSDTGEIVWDTAQPDRATFQVNALAVRAITGYVADRAFELGDVTVRFGPTSNNFAAFAVAALDGKPIADSASLLLVAAGRVENTGMVWNEDRTSVSNNWGTAPTLVEGIPVRVSLPGRVARASALDGTGVPMQEVPVASGAAGSQLKLGPEWRTVWYHLAR